MPIVPEIPGQRPLKFKEMVNKPKKKFTKRQVHKAEENWKMHISYICRRNPKKYRIIRFAQTVASRKI